ncbi:MAG: hypothetical protein ACR2LQ_05175 [Acidimicrobiales bacterium]
MAAPSVVLLPLTRAAVFRLVLWSALDGFFVGVVIVEVALLASGASAQTGQILRLIGPLGLLVGGVIARIRAPAMGILADRDGIELHGFWRTRSFAWSTISAIGWMAPGRRFTVRMASGALKAGPGKLPRRVSAELAGIAREHGVEVVADRSLAASVPAR